MKEIHPALKHLRIADLELFITAAHLKNLGRAAVVHHLSQSAASAAIQRVEAAFGKALCTHEKRQFRLTKEGLSLLPRAEAWLRQLCETVVGEDQSPVRIVTTHAIAKVAIPPLLSREKIELNLSRPDSAYAAVLRDEADVALVLDNAPWEGVIASEIGKGSFQLYSIKPPKSSCAVLLPEDQMEVLHLQQRWQQIYSSPLQIKVRLPSWSLIADICIGSNEVGFLPEFLTQRTKLKPVAWQPTPSKYRILALYKKGSRLFQDKVNSYIDLWKKMF